VVYNKIKHSSATKRSFFISEKTLAQEQELSLILLVTNLTEREVITIQTFQNQELYAPCLHSAEQPNL
jgi:hypothetical protein